MTNEETEKGLKPDLISQLTPEKKQGETTYVLGSLITFNCQCGNRAVIKGFDTLNFSTDHHIADSGKLVLNNQYVHCCVCPDCGKEKYFQIKNQALEL